MKKSLSKGRIAVIFLLLILLTAMFVFSSQDIVKSADQSNQVVEFLKSLGIDASDHFVRKAAHFTEFMLLGILMYCLFGNLFALPPCVIVAMADEYHQTFIDGRAGMWTDVLLDSAGALFGVLIVWGICRIKRKRKTKKQVKPQ